MNSNQCVFRAAGMAYDKDKVDEMVLALLHLTSWQDGPATCTWKTLDWEAMDRLFAKGYISNPKRKAKSVVLTAAGRTRAAELFRQHFGVDEDDDPAARRPIGRAGQSVRPAAIAGKGYRLKITLGEIRPPIWRRILVPDISFARLHEILQAVMGWRNYHLYLFEIDGVSYTDPESAAEMGMEVADEAALGSVLRPEGGRFRYLYDWGDRWEHDIVVEAVLPLGAEQVTPACLAGKRRCPPEDLGGDTRYDWFLEVLGDPRHEERVEVMRWMRVCNYRPFDPEAFDRDAVNKALRRLG